MYRLRFFISIIFFLTVFASCISNKKHAAEVAALEERYQLEIDQLDNNFRAADSRATELTLQLAEEAGVNRSLANMQRIYMIEIDSLQNAIAMMGSNAQNTQANLGSQLQEKDDQINTIQNGCDAILM